MLVSKPGHTPLRCRECCDRDNREIRDHVQHIRRCGPPPDPDCLGASVRVPEGWIHGRQAGPGARPPPCDPLQAGPGGARLQGTHGPRVWDVQHGQYLLSKLDIAGTPIDQLMTY